MERASRREYLIHVACVDSRLTFLYGILATTIREET